MITRPISKPHICLSCRRSLAKRISYPATRVARQSTESTPQLRQSPEETSDDQPPDETGTPNNEGLVRRSVGSLPKGPNGSVSRHPLGRLHGYSGLKMRENYEELKAVNLGARANVIVLRDSGVSTYEAKDEVTAKKAEHIDILGQLDDERGLIGLDKIRENINEFRPKDGDGLRDREGINDLVLQLQHGFTITQLEDYIERFEGKQAPESAPAEWVTNKKVAAIIRITPWQPGISFITQSFDNDPLRGYLLASHTAKQRVILRLLRECWRVELPELEEGIGQFEIQIRQEDFHLLSSTS